MANSNNQLGNWALWLGALIALVAVFVPGLPYTGVLLLVLGAVGGYMAVPDKEAHQFVVFALGLWIGVATLSALSELSPQLDVVKAVGDNLVSLVSAGALAVALKALARVSGLMK
ncbi:hypothetical protein HYV82_05360 [Candidatus Woesearchaeota archaeon]|nr:hypothetical protein [Candidatus Woesearchaeota archaeon]